MNYIVTTQHIERRAILAAVAVPVFLGSVDVTIVSAVLPRILTDIQLSVTLDSLSSVFWIVTGYLLGYALSLFTMGRASDRIGRRAALALCLALYVSGALLVSFYTVPSEILISLGMGRDLSILLALVLGRTVQALGAGAITAIALALVSDLYPQGERARPLGLVAAVDTVGWLLGAAVGGVVVQYISWRLLFLLNVPLWLIALLYVLRRLPDMPQKRAARFDWGGALLLAIVLTLFNVSMNNLNAGELGAVGWPLALALVGLVIFLLYERRAGDVALLDWRMLRGRTVLGANVVNALAGYALFVAIVIMPLLVNLRNLEALGFFSSVVEAIQEEAVLRSAIETGVMLATFTVPLAVAVALGGMLSARFRSQRVLLSGLVLAGVGFVAFALVMTDVQTSYAVLAPVMALMGLGLGLVFTPVVLQTLAAVPEDGRGMASSLVLGVRMVAMSAAANSLSVLGTGRINQIVAQIEAPNSRFFSTVAAADYPMVYTNTFVMASVQVFSEMALIGLGLCGVALIVALLANGVGGEA